MAIKLKPSKGFTLVELIVVIVILGILGAVALPKFINIGKDTRIASLNGLKVALQSTANSPLQNAYWILLASLTCQSVVSHQQLLTGKPSTSIMDIQQDGASFM